MRSRYGGAAGAAAHEQQFNWYHRGGPVRRMASGGSAGPVMSPGFGQRLLEKLFEYWIKHYAGFRRAHHNIYDHLHGEKLFKYWESHWGTWIKDNMFRVRGGGGSGGGSGGGGSGGGKDTPRQTAGEALIKIFEHGSLASMISRMHTLLADIRKFFSGDAAKDRERLVRKQIEHLKDIRDKISHIAARIQAARQYAASVTQGLQSYTDVAGLPLGGGYVGTRYRTGGQMIASQLATKLANLRKFARVLKRLVQLKVPKELLREIVAAGPDQGLAIAQEILAGGPALMKQLQGEESAIAKIEKEIGRGAASGVFEGKWYTGKNFVKDLEHEKAHLERLFRRLGRVMAEELERWFNVPDPHRRHRHHRHAGGGIIPEHVWGYGRSGATYEFGESGPERVTPLSGGMNGPLVSVGELHIHEEADMRILEHKLNFAILSAGLS